MANQQLGHKLLVHPLLIRKREVFRVPSTTKLIVHTAPRSQPQTPVPPPAVRATARPALYQSQMINRPRVEFAPPRVPVTPHDGDKIAKLRNCGAGRVLIIVGNGPSLTEAPLERLRDHPLIDIMSINKPDPRLWPTTYWAFCDQSQYRRHETLWQAYNGVIINSTSTGHIRHNTTRIKPLQGQGFSRDLLKGFHVGRSTIYASMQTALWMNYDQTYIFAIDMNPDGIAGKLWFYGVNPDVPPEKRRERFKNEAGFYATAAGILSPAERARFTFCSTYNPWPFVDSFNRLDQTQAVDIILSRLTPAG